MKWWVVAVIGSVACGQTHLTVCYLPAAPVSPAPPCVHVDDDAIDFGLVEGVDSVVARELLIHNLDGEGCDGTMEIYVLEVDGDDDFSVRDLDRVILDPGESASASLVFAPSRAGLADGTVTIGTNDLDNPSVSISLTGEATGD